MADSLAAVGEKDYVLLSKNVKVKLARNDDEKLNGCFSICFWLYIDSCASFPSVILEQKHPEIMSSPPLVWLNEEKKMTLFPILFLHQESPSPDDSFPWAGVPCTSMQNEFPMKKWVHVGCEFSQDLVRLHIDGEIVGESSLTCTLNKVFFWMTDDSKLDKDSYANAFKKLHFACPNDIEVKFHGYVHGLDLCPLSAVKDHLVKDPPVTLFVDHSSASEMDEDSIWNVAGGEASTHSIFSLSVSLLDAFSSLVMKNFEVVASLLYADNQAPVENNGDAEPPLLVFLDGVEYASHCKPYKLENGCAVLKLKISQLSSKCDNRLFQIRVGIPELGSYPFLETLSVPVRCVSRGQNTKTASLIQNKSSNKIDSNVDGLEVNDESMELIPDIVHEMESSPAKRVKLGQDEPFEGVKEDLLLEIPNNKCDSHASINNELIKLGQDEPFERCKEDLPVELPNNQCDSHASISDERVELMQDEPSEICKEDLSVELPNNRCDSYASISNEAELMQDEPFEMCEEDLPVELPNNRCDSHASISNKLVKFGQDEPFELCKEDPPVELPNTRCDSHASISNERVEIGQDEPFDTCKDELPVELLHDRCNSHDAISNERVEVGQGEAFEMCKEDLPAELPHNQCNSHAAISSEENPTTNMELENSYRAESNPTTSNGGEASNNDPKKMLNVSSAFLDLIIFKYCLGNHGERCILLKEISTSVCEQLLVDFADGVSLYSGCSHHRHQIRISRRLIKGGIQAWTSISQNHIEVHWNDLLSAINDEFLKIARCTRSLTYQEFEFLRRIAGCVDLVFQENFERMWCWLYPVALTLSQSVVTPIWDSVSLVWMEGFISKEEAESALCRPGGGPEDPGTFILRFPASRSWPHPDAGSLVVTYVGSDFAIHHRLLSHDVIHSCSSQGRNGRLLSEMLLQEPELSRLGRITRSRWTI